MVPLICQHDLYCLQCVFGMEEHDDSPAKEIEAAPPNDDAALRNESQASVEGDGVRWRRSREC